MLATTKPLANRHSAAIASSSALTLDLPPPSPPSYSGPDDPLHTPDEQLLPAYESHATLAPWLALLDQTNWESVSDLALFFPPTPVAAVQLDPASPTKGVSATPSTGWKAEYAEHVRQCLDLGIHLDPCDDVRHDFMFNAIVDEIRQYVRTEMPPELRCTSPSIHSPTIRSSFSSLSSSCRPELCLLFTHARAARA
jgi:hypothetical protein